jgi:hypothetical protein
MNSTDAASIVSTTLDGAIQNGSGLHVRFRIAELGAETATIQLEVSDVDGIAYVKEQPVPLLPRRGIVEPARYLAFVEGIRKALACCDLEPVMPADLLIADLLRVPSLRRAEDFTRAILDSSVRAELLAAIQIADLGRDAALPPIQDAAACVHLWHLWRGDRYEVLEREASALAAGLTLECVPYLITILEGWLVRMARTGGVSFLTGDDRNADVVLARRLEPALRRLAGPSEQRRLEALAVMGLFDEAHEDGHVQFMYGD